MNRKTVLALALAGAFGLTNFAAFAYDEKKDEQKPQVVAEDEKKDEQKPQLIADDEKKYAEKPQRIAEGDDRFPTGSTPELIA